MSLKYATYINDEGKITRSASIQSGEGGDMDNDVWYEDYRKEGTEWAKKQYDDLNGYYYTWDPASHGDMMKAKFPTTPKGDVKAYSGDGILQAYYIAGHYNPGVTVTGSNVSKWFLPTVGQFILAYRKLKIMDVQLSDYMFLAGTFYYFSKNINAGSFKDEVFSKVGGDPLHKSPYVDQYNDNNQIWTSIYGSILYNMVISFYEEGKIYTDMQRTYFSCLVRPFVHF